MLGYTYIACLLLNFMAVVKDVPGNMMQYSKVSSEVGIILVITANDV
jgi:hypothetical protein